MQKMKKWTRIHYMPPVPLYEGRERVTASKEHIDLARYAAAEGTVLLKNDAHILPLKHGSRVALFGKAQSDYVKGGGGSGDVTTAYARSLLQGMRIKQEDGKIVLFDVLSDFYQSYVDAAYAEGKAPGQIPEPDVPQELVEQAVGFADIAIITICRYSCEALDRCGDVDGGDFYLSPEEKRMVKAVLENFEKVAVVLNVGGIVDTKWIKNDPRVCAALLPWQGGIEGGLAMADVLCGDASPNGRLTDTFAADFQAYPSSEIFHESEDYVEYQEDIYVGYRYFETIPGAVKNVCYPFGYGLSYTEFAYSNISASFHDEEFSVKVDITNTGSWSGREVAQLYVQAPQGKLGKPARCLIGFAKTATLKPGETERLVISGKTASFASYDDMGKVCKSAFLLEAGDYLFYLGKNVEAAERIDAVYTVPATQIIEQLTAKCVPNQLHRQMNADGSYEDLACYPNADHYEAMPQRYYPRDNSWTVPYDFGTPLESCDGQPIEPQLIDVYNGKITLDEFVNVLSLEQKINLLGGQPNRGIANTFGFGNLLQYGVPNAMTADGPAGLRIRPVCHVNTTAFPCATLIACTWDLDLARQVGIAAAEEVKENGFGIWLAPGMNIHRNPLCGRNFEYYSEDPLLSGLMAAASVSGIQSQGIAATIKHFACNNKETNRTKSDSRVSERALREIYLKGFEICIKTAKPWIVMSSYNRLNGVYTSENKELLTDILRDEWGYDGMVCSDWDNAAVQYHEIAAGNDIKMCSGTPEHTLEMVKMGKLSEEAVTQSAKRVLQLILRLD